MYPALSVTTVLNAEQFYNLITFSKTKLEHAQSHKHIMPIDAEQKMHDL